MTTQEMRRAYLAERRLPDGVYEGPLRCEEGLEHPYHPRVQQYYFPCGRPAHVRVDGKVFCQQHAKHAARQRDLV